MRRLAPPSSSLTNYRLVVHSVLGDALWRFRKRIPLLAAFGGLGIFLQGGALAAALLYARSLEKGDPVRLGGQQLDPRSDVELLAIVAVLLAVALSGGGYLLYRFKSGAVELGREYESLRSSETLAAVCQLPHPEVPDSATLLDEEHIARVQQDSRLCGRVLRNTVEGFVPATIVPVTVIILLALNIYLTLLLLCLTATVAVVIFRINRRGARASERMERLGKEAMRERKLGVKTLLTGDLRSSTSWRVPERDANSATKQHLHAYTDRLQAIEDSGLATSLITGLALGSILLLEGRSVLIGASSISALVAYLVVLRLFLTNFMRLSRSLSSVSRFYPQVKRHFTFANKLQRLSDLGRTTPAFPCILTLTPLHHQHGDPHPTVTAGQRLLFLTNDALTRKLLASFADTLAPAHMEWRGSAHVRVVEPFWPVPSATLPQSFGFAPDVSLPEFGEAVSKAVPRDELLEVERWDQEDGQAFSLEWLSNLDITTIWFIRFLAAVSWSPEVVMVHTTDWLQSSDVVREAVLEAAEGFILVFVADTARPPRDLKFDLAVFAVNNQVIGWHSSPDVQSAVEAFRNISWQSEAQSPRGAANHPSPDFKVPPSREQDDEEDD